MSSRTPVGRATVPKAFDRIAATYDRLTAANPGYRAHLELSARRMGLGDAPRVLDLCCGTGLSTAALRAVYPDAELVGLDASEGMLARARSKPLGARWVHGDATDPRAAGVEGSFDGVFMAYGLRNLPDPDRALANILELLEPGGVLAVHEYALSGPRSKLVWNAVALGIIVPAGLLTAGDAAIYRYLRRSVNEFDDASALQRRLLRAGFRQVRREDMSGWQRGVVHTFLAVKPRAGAKA